MQHYKKVNYMLQQRYICQVPIAQKEMAACVLTIMYLYQAYTHKQILLLLSFNRLWLQSMSAETLGQETACNCLTDMANTCTSS